MAEYNDELLDHEYDGIRELDNQLPRWWLYLFYFTIAWAVAYMAYYHVFQIGYSQEDEYRQEMDPSYVRINEADTRLLGVIPEYHSPLYSPRADLTPWERLHITGAPQIVMLTAATDTTTYQEIDDPVRLAAGKESYARNCAQCHGANGEGGIGPNLTDAYWLNGNGDVSFLVKSVTYGYSAKGMIPWRGVMQPEEILNVANYVRGLRGTNPPNPKAPQGELVEE